MRWLVVALVCLGLSGCDIQPPAFPGAEGFGAETPGGRRGRLLFVENLNDSGPGSLRAALETPEPRVIVFRVGGTITLQSPLELTSPYVTVAGQSAPGGGIQIRNDPYAPFGLAADSFQSIRIATHDVVLRYLRVRPGPLDPNPACTRANALVYPLGYDTCVDAADIRAINILPEAHHVVLDHLSLAWSSDELVAIQGATDVTLQWSILAEGMDFVLYEGFVDGRYYRTHGHGIITGDDWSARAGEMTNRLSIHHNLWAHNMDRNPSITSNCASPAPSGDCTADVVNNVTYNWGDIGTYFANPLGHAFVNVEKNFYRPGPDTPNLNHVMMLNDWTRSVFAVVPDAALGVHLSGNRVQVSDTQIVDAVTQCNRWNTLAGRWDPCDVTAYLLRRNPAPVVNTSPAELARDDVLSGAGASRRLTALGALRANRDAADAGVVADVWAGTGRIIKEHDDFPGWPSLAGGSAPADNDRDGMPSAWERAQCLDPLAPNDARDSDGDVYTDVEEYLNGTLATDGDHDGVPDHRDNCRSVANASQRDDDASPDGLGDACDCDFDGDGDCDLEDATRFAWCLASSSFPSCNAVDLNDDGVVGALDETLHDAARADGLPGPGASVCPF